jgi:hypothetical protein
MGVAVRAGWGAPDGHHGAGAARGREASGGGRANNRDRLESVTNLLRRRGDTMLTKRYALLPVVFALSGCTGTLPEPETGQKPKLHLQPIESVAPPGASSSDADRYGRHRSAARAYCLGREGQLDAFALQLKNGEAKRKLWGGVITAVVGAGGSIATAISSSQQKVSGSGADVDGKDRTTAIGAVTAGATSVSAALTLAVIGPSSAETVAAIERGQSKLSKAWGDFDTACPPTTTSYVECIVRADDAAAGCAAAVTGVQLPVPPYVPPQ